MRPSANITSINLIITSFEILGLCVLMILALLIQFYLKEPPCPLCLLQRFGFMGIMLAVSLNLRFGYKANHTGLSLLFAIFTAFVALRQIAIHIVPGSGSYGSKILGLHLYTWSFVVSIAFIIFNCIVLCIENLPINKEVSNKTQNKTYIALFFIVGTIILINLVSTFFECGLGSCPENPVTYMIATYF